MDTLVDGVSYLLTGPGTSGAGFYHGDTRHLTPLSVTIDGVDLSALSKHHARPAGRTCLYSDVGSAINEVTDAAASNRAITILERRQQVREGVLRETISVQNSDSGSWEPRVGIDFDADFADIFEIRGVDGAIDRSVSSRSDERTVRYSYTYESDWGRGNRDGACTLETTVRFDPAPRRLDRGRATYEPTLESQETWTITVEVVPGGDLSTVHAAQSEAAESSNGTGRPRIDPFVSDAPIETDDEERDRTFAQARRDLLALTTRTEHGPVPLAGAPWFVTVFGRDSLLTALQLLPFAPDLARGTLEYLAAHQGTETGERTDEAAGKILHEVRSGELARTGATPATHSFGTIDATPLWVVLLGETWRWTGDDELVEDLRPNLEAALSWIERQAAAVGGDPFLYYREFGTAGVVHKTWRDSAQGVQYADGAQATPPLASAAVQGLGYRAYCTAAELSSAVFGDDERAEALGRRAQDLRAKFDDAFWMSNVDYYATALTPDHDHVDSLTSNLGHCLWTGVVPESRADRLADLLLGPDLFSGWGVRTTSAGERGYRPVSYHAGSVWPHDNVVAATGLARYGYHDGARRIALRQLDAFAHFDGNSVPELFCGFDDDRPPVPYPAACRPQAWSAAAPFGLLGALFALAPDSDGEPVVGNEPPDIDVTAITDVIEHWQDDDLH